jgi:DNA-binding NtrC family response regulator
MRERPGSMDKILIVEDVDTLRDVLVSVLQSQGYLVEAYGSAEDAIPAIRRSAFSCVLCDFKLPGQNGLEFLRELRKVSRGVPFIIMTAFGTLEIAAEAMRLGANDFLCKPFEPSTLCGVIRDIVRHRRIVDRAIGTASRRERSFLSESPAVQKILDQSRKVARVDTSVLILGESGTGKELVARHIHEHSARANEPFVAVNCAALPSELLESEFFGHESGAFTGATQTRIGVFELASSGTIFLDEVGDMPPALQVKLLRALQEREIKRIGSNKMIKVNPRVIAATNQNVEELLESGAMREDFYYRIAVVTLALPALRERKSDIDVLANYFIEYFSARMEREKPSLSEGARALLHAYSWPGNARELENVVERAVILAGDSILAEHLGVSADGIGCDGEPALSLTEIGEQAARKAEVELIIRTLERTRGNKSKAAQILGISYKTLLNKVRDYQLAPAKSRETEAEGASAEA